jgi:hypothetical protein
MRRLPQVVFSSSVPFNFFSLYSHLHCLHTHTSIRPTCLKGFSDGNDKHIGSTKAFGLEAVVEEATRVKKRNTRQRERERDDCALP